MKTTLSTMKTFHYFILLLLVIPFEVTSCNSVSNNTEELSNNTEDQIIAQIETETPSAIAPYGAVQDAESLSSPEITGILLMREEEKMAKDVYTFFYNKFNYRIFNNISKSETVHAEAMLRLITYFKLSDPSTTTAGTYSNPELQELYNKFVSEATTVEDALRTGAFIEEYDIADLKKLISETGNSYIIRVYSNLKRGSENHLRAFTRMLKLKGIVYEPQILDKEEYLSIINK